MIKKVVGILIVGLLMATILPVGSSVAETIDEKDINTLSSSQIEITIKGGFAIHAFIKNVGTADLNDVDMTIVLDGRLIFPPYRNRETTACFEAGKTVHHIIPVFGFGTTNIEITVDGTTETASATVLGRMVFGVQ